MMHPPIYIVALFLLLLVLALSIYIETARKPIPAYIFESLDILKPLCFLALTASFALYCFND